MTDETEVFTVYTAARELKCTSHWVRTLLAEERLPGAYKDESGRWQIPGDALRPIKAKREAISA